VLSSTVIDPPGLGADADPVEPLDPDDPEDPVVELADVAAPELPAELLEELLDELPQAARTTAVNTAAINGVARFTA
jgi:hypothetical protein